MSDESPYKIAYKAFSLADAHLLKDQLEAAGIDVQLNGETLGVAFGGLDASLVKILVPEDDLDAAQNIARDHEAKRLEQDGPRWDCPGCAEENESNFEICWNCGKERP
jgi:hypothetical protein